MRKKFIVAQQGIKSIKKTVVSEVSSFVGNPVPYDEGSKHISFKKWIAQQLLNFWKDKPKYWKIKF